MKLALLSKRFFSTKHQRSIQNALSLLKNEQSKSLDKVMNDHSHLLYKYRSPNISTRRTWQNMKKKDFWLCQRYIQLVLYKL
jgi:hypothetical protein